MTRIIFYGSLFLVFITIETSFLSSLGSFWRTFPLVPIVGVWLYHQNNSKIGWWYLLGWGIWYDLFQLSLWSSYAVIAIVMMILLSYASGRLFSNRSLYGFLGVGILLWFAWFLVESLFRFFSPAPLAVAFYQFTIQELVLMGQFLGGMMLLFLLHLQLRDRLSRV